MNRKKRTGSKNVTVNLKNITNNQYLLAIYFEVVENLPGQRESGNQVAECGYQVVECRMRESGSRMRESGSRMHAEISLLQKKSAKRSLSIEKKSRPMFSGNYMVDSSKG